MRRGFQRKTGEAAAGSLSPVAEGCDGRGKTEAASLGSVGLLWAVFGDKLGSWTNEAVRRRDQATLRP